MPFRGNKLFFYEKFSQITLPIGTTFVCGATTYLFYIFAFIYGLYIEAIILKLLAKTENGFNSKIEI